MKVDLSAHGFDFPEHKEGPIAGAYAIQHEASGSFYLGSSEDLYARKKNHESALRRGVHSNPALQGLFKEDPKLKFVAFPATDVDKAIALEQNLLNDFHSHAGNLNVASDALASMKGIPKSEETRQKLSQSKMGVKLSPEHVEAVRLANTGKKRTDDFCQQMSDLNKGRERTETQLASMAASNSARSNEISVAGLVYPSVHDAARATGINHCTLRQRANSKNFEDVFYPNKEL